MFELELSDARGTLRLNRPEARNAIPLDGWRQLSARIDEAERSQARLLVVAGAGGAFCAGADLADFPRLAREAETVARFRREMRESLDRLARLSLPTVALVDGPCFGAGVALAIACDVRIAAESARFAVTPARLGISYPQEDVARLVALVGPGQAARLLLGAVPLDSAEALRIGLVEEVAADADAAVAELAAALIANSRESIAALKRGIGRAVAGAATDPEQDRRFDALFASPEMERRLAALRRRG